MIKPPVLMIDRSTSQCYACGQQAFPYEKSHDEIAGYGAKGRVGCGVTWKYISSNYAQMPDQKPACQEMRPDLEWLDYSEIWHKVVDLNPTRVLPSASGAKVHFVTNSQGIWVSPCGLNFTKELVTPPEGVPNCKKCLDSNTYKVWLNTRTINRVTNFG